jgi:hypothetical protein
VREIFGHELLGAYQHGSAVLGGVQPTSDIDILVITGCLATLVEKRQLVEGLIRNLLLRLARIGRPSSRPLSTVRIERPTGRWSDCRRIINSSWSGRGPSILAGSRMNGPIWHPKPAPVRTT